MKRALVGFLLAALFAALVWQYRESERPSPVQTSAGTTPSDDLLDRLHSRNPEEAGAASREISALGARALPVIQETLRDPQAEADRLKAALKGVGILGQAAAPIIDEVAAALGEPGLTAEAAVALSHMGRHALPPLRDALSSADPIVRREALRSIGKLKERAPLDAAAVVPLLIQEMDDPDASVRTVAATYLGIIHESPETAVPALVAGLKDESAEVRTAAATALGSFGEAAAPALQALRRAAGDRNPEVAREAGRAIVNLQQQK